jgi:hypothetical protein
MRSMPLRVIAVLLAFVLLWSGVGTIEAPRTIAPPTPEQQHSFVHGDSQGEAHQGSVDDHHLDDVPAQAQSDTPPETPGLLPPPLTPRLHGALLTQPRVLSSVEPASPFLAGPLRPPCVAALAG